MLFDPEKYRRDFPILSRQLAGNRPLIYLDNAASTQHPRLVTESILDTYENHYANVHRGIHQLAEEADLRYGNAREKVREFIGARSTEEVIFTSGATAGINLVARSWGDSHLHSGDEILLTEMEHHSNLVPWQQLAQRTGARLKHLPVTEDGLLELNALDTLLREKTKLVAFTAVSNVLGTINPAKEIIRRAHEVGALVLLDGAQSVPHQPTEVTDLDCDFLVFSGHKMLGPTGIGVLYGKRELLETMPPFLGGGGMIKDVFLDRFTEGELPDKFEAGTPPIVPAIALGAAIDYLQKVGMDAIFEYEHLLMQHAHKVLNQVSGVRILGPVPIAPVENGAFLPKNSADHSLHRKAAIVSFTMEGIHAHDIAQLVDRQGIAIRAGHHCAMPLHARYRVSATVRASFYFYNTLEEVEKLGESLESLKKVFRRK